MQLRVHAFTAYACTASVSTQTTVSRLAGYGTFQYLGGHSSSALREFTYCTRGTPLTASEPVMPRWSLCSMPISGRPQLLGEVSACAV